MEWVQRGFSAAQLAINYAGWWPRPALLLLLFAAGLCTNAMLSLLSVPELAQTLGSMVR
jgi:hypothetical protein